MTARPSPSLPHNTRQQQKPGPRGSSEHWRRTRNRCRAPALASLLAEPGRRRGLLSAYDRALRRHEQAGHVERAGRERKGRGRPATIWRITTAGRGWLDDHDNAPDLAAAAAAQARRAAAERDQALDEARATFTRQTPRISRKRAAHRLRDLGCTLDQIGAVFHVSKERIRQDLLWDPPGPRRHANPEKAVMPGRRRRCRRRCDPGCRGSDRSGGWCGGTYGRQSGPIPPGLSPCCKSVTGQVLHCPSVIKQR